MRKDPHRGKSQDQCAHLNTAGQSRRPKKFEKNQYFGKGLVALKLGVKFEIDKSSRCFLILGINVCAVKGAKLELGKPHECFQ